MPEDTAEDEEVVVVVHLGQCRYDSQQQPQSQQRAVVVEEGLGQYIPAAPLVFYIIFLFHTPFLLIIGQRYILYGKQANINSQNLAISKNLCTFAA